MRPEDGMLVATFALSRTSGELWELARHFAQAAVVKEQEEQEGGESGESSEEQDQDHEGNERRSMTTQTAFGRVLSGLLGERGIEATPETVGQPVINRMVTTEADHPGSLKPLVEELGLSSEEISRLAMAFTFEEE